MTTAIIFGARPRLLLRIARRLEVTFPDFGEVTDVGEGVHEDRAEFRAILRRFRVHLHEDGRVALEFLTAAARTRFQTLLSTLKAKLAADRTQDEQDVVDLPAEETLDATWDGGGASP
jgi:hypothetical protein